MEVFIFRSRRSIAFAPAC